MKKLINNPADVVKEELMGIALAHGDLVRVHFDPAYVVRADAPVQGKVAVISGGGSGHEPMHGGYVGKGMLDAACPGQVFTSPTPDQIEAATLAVNGGAGVLHIVKNYSGDIMNFEMAAELCQALGLWANVEIKPSSGHEAATGRRVALEARELWSGLPPPLLSSFSAEALAAADAAAVLAQLQVLFMPTLMVINLAFLFKRVAGRFTSQQGAAGRSIKPAAKRAPPKLAPEPTEKLSGASVKEKPRGPAGVQYF